MDGVASSREGRTTYVVQDGLGVSASRNAAFLLLLIDTKRFNPIPSRILRIVVEREFTLSYTQIQLYDL